MNRAHLICNAHLDPVWLWQWEDGAAEAVSTFRIAADFCEQFDGFVFNHNEAILYKWVEEFEPELFNRIRKLIHEGKWHIMGGWYLQPDCNMPSGESFVRQILLGRTYFKEKFGVMPTTAVNLDPFGHTRGIVQLLKKSGYDSYLFWRPERESFRLPAEDFTWVGYDGSEITGHRSYDPYRADMGQAHAKITEWLDNNRDRQCGFILWGVGNHGGGPSRVDLENIQKLIKDTGDFEIIHSTPEAYVSEIRKTDAHFPKFYGDLNPSLIGCYTSMIRIKQKHRALENNIYMAEKMLSHAALSGLLKYPAEKLNSAVRDLAFCEFHDILPGSMLYEGEEDSLRTLGHGLEIASQLKAGAFFALAAGQEKAKDGEIPLFIYNPHPYKLKGIFECEFNLPERNLEKSLLAVPIVYQDGNRLPGQVEKPSCSINNDWRKKAAFYAELLPSRMNRFDCRIELVDRNRPAPALDVKNGRLIFKTEELEVHINCQTGLIDKYAVNGVSYLKENAFLPVAIKDSDDSWGGVPCFSDVAGTFTLMSDRDGSAFSDISGEPVPSVRVIEDGEARTVAEAVLSYGNSCICQTYRLPKKGTQIEVDCRVYWNEKSTMLKLSIPTLLKDGKYLGQVAYGVESHAADGNEVVSQKWSGIFSENDDKAFTCINDGIYGSDFKDAEIRLSLLRSPGYACDHYGNDRIYRTKRHNLRMEQGERHFCFLFNAGSFSERMEAVDREALAYNEKPYALSFYPSGDGVKPAPLIELDGHTVQMTVFKKAEKSEDYIIRLFEPAGQSENILLTIPTAGLKQEVYIGGYEVKTLKLDPQSCALTEVNLIEE